MAQQTEVSSIYLRLALENDIQSQIQQASEQTAQTAASSFGSMFKKAFSIAAITAVVGKIKSAAEEYQAAYQAAIEPEIKLATVMKQRMQATQDEVDSIIEYAGALEKVGVVGADAAAAGAQQLATFLNSSEALKTLIPAMNNLVAQQKGYNATQGDAVSIGNLFGKVMQGQTTALTKVGITFSEAEEQALKYADEEERAAILAEIITNNVGEMNTALASTDAGKLLIISNKFGEVQESLGKSYMTLKTLFIPALEVALDVFTTIADKVSYIVNEAKEMAIKYGFIEDNSASAEMQALQEQKAQIEAQIEALKENTESNIEASENTLSSASFDKFNILSIGDAAAQLVEASENLNTASEELDLAGLEKQLEEISKKIDDLAKKGVGSSGTGGNVFEDVVNEVYNEMTEAIPGSDKLGDFLTKWVIYPLAQTLANVWNNLPQILEQTKTDIVNLFKTVAGPIAILGVNAINGIGDFFGLISGLLTGNEEKIRESASSLADDCYNMVFGPIESFIEGIRKFWDESIIGQMFADSGIKFIEKVEEVGYKRSASANQYSPYARQDSVDISGWTAGFANGTGMLGGVNYQPSVISTKNTGRSGSLDAPARSGVSGSFGDTNVTIPVYLDGEEIYNTAIKGINRQSQLKGKSQIK